MISVDETAAIFDRTKITTFPQRSIRAVNQSVLHLPLPLRSFRLSLLLCETPNALLIQLSGRLVGLLSVARHQADTM